VSHALNSPKRREERRMLKAKEVTRTKRKLRIEGLHISSWQDLFMGFGPKF
jgi:hypothetical protein